MSSPINSQLFETPQFPTRPVLYWMAVLLAIAVAPFLIWPILADRILASNFLPHLYCYLGKPGLVWTHVIADSLIGLSYVMISGTLGYLAHKGRRDIPFHWMFLAFGSFIVACGGTHFMEVVTVWVPVYVLSASLKVVTALVSMATAVLLPFTVPRVLSVVRTAKASEAAEAKFHQIADNIQEIFWMVDAITKQAIYVNPAFEQITGRTCASLQEAPLSYHEIIHQDDRARVLGRLDEALRTGKFEEEFRITRPDGTIRWVGTQGFPVRDAQGNIYRLAGVVQDITERKRAEEALRQSEDRYRDLVEHSQDLLCTHDLEGNLLSTNPAPARILGYEVAELLKIPMRELIAPEFREQFDQYLVSVKTARMDRGLMAVVTRTGERRIWEYHNTLRTEGVPSPIVRGMAHDITDRIRAERERRASEERFRQLAENIREVFYLIDRQSHRSLYISPAYEEVWGRTCQSLYEDPESFMEAIHPDDRDAARQAYGSHKPFMHEYRIVRPDGSTRWIWDRGFPIRNEKGEIYRLAGIAEDITERKSAEQALQEAQAELARMIRIATMGELTASIAHEINQPLAAVVTNGSATLRWLAMRPPNLKQARKAVTSAIQEANRASKVIARIRALLRKGSSQMAPLDVNEVIREVLALVGDELTRGGVTAQTKLAVDVPAVFGDRVQLQQVILNLIMNGIDAMSTIGDRPRDLLIQSEAHPEGVLIHVEDSGRGLEREQAGRIFEPFFTTKPQGIGMGLSISRSIVETHGGRLWAAPAASHGAVFQLILPKAA
jgi:PAS domain S-box-containing protein